MDSKRLIKRVDYQDNWTESDKVYYFTKELRHEIALQLRPHLTFRANVTLEQVIEAARQMEENNVAYPEALTGFYNPMINTSPVTMNYNPPLTNSNADVHQLLGGLIQTINGMNINNNQRRNNINNKNNQRPRNNINTEHNNRPPRNNITCYWCNQVGHIARNCSIINNNQPNVNQVQNQ